MSRRIVVVGSLNMDLVARVPRLAQTGETIAAHAFSSHLGGKGANQAVACARLDAETYLIGRVGDDSFGEQLRDGVAAYGVDVSCVEMVPGTSGLALIAVDDAAQNSITVVAGANEHLSPGELQRHMDVVRGASVVLAQLETPIETVLLLARAADEAGVCFLLDPAPARVLPAELLERVTWLTPNETESGVLLGSAEKMAPEETARRLLAGGCRNVVLKLGSAGVFLAGEDVAPTHLPAFEVDAVESTAAGDCFNGAFAVALSEGRPPLEAARFACAAAALSVTRHGAAESMPTRVEVDAFLAQRTSAE